MNSEARLAILERRLAMHMRTKRLRVVILKTDELIPTVGPDERLVVILPANRFLKCELPAAALEIQSPAFAVPPAPEPEDVQEDDLENVPISELEAEVARLEGEISALEKKKNECS